MRSDTKFSIPSIPNIRDGWADGMDVFKFSCEGDVAADLAELKRKGYLQSR